MLTKSDMEVLGYISRDNSDELLQALTEKRELYTNIKQDHYYLGQTDEQLIVLTSEIPAELNKWASDTENYRLNAKRPIEKLILRAEDALKRKRAQREHFTKQMRTQPASTAAQSIQTQTQSVVNLKAAAEKSQSIQDAQANMKDSASEIDLGFWTDPDPVHGRLCRGVCVTVGSKRFIKLTYDAYEKTAHHINSYGEALDPLGYKQVKLTRIITVRKWYRGILFNAQRFMKILKADQEKQAKKASVLLKEMTEVRQTLFSAKQSLQIELKKQLENAKNRYYEVSQINTLEENNNEINKAEEVCKHIRNLIRELNELRGASDVTDWDDFPYRCSNAQTNNCNWDEYLKDNQETDLYDYENEQDEKIETEWYIYLAEREKEVLLNAQNILNQLKLSKQNKTSAIVVDDDYNNSLIESEKNVNRQKNILAEAHNGMHRIVSEHLKRRKELLKNLKDFQQNYNEAARNADKELYSMFLNTGFEIQLLQNKIKNSELELEMLLAKYPPMRISAIPEENLNKNKEDSKRELKIAVSKTAIEKISEKPKKLTSSEQEALVQKLYLPDHDNHLNPKRIPKLNWWPELALRIKRLKTKNEGDLGYECGGIRGVTEEGAVIFREGPCLTYLFGWGSTFGAIRQIRKLWPDTEEESFNDDAVLGLAGGMVGFIIGCIRMGYLDPYSKIAHTIFLSLAEACAIFIFVTGEIITVYCNDKTHWFPMASSNNATMTMACTVSDSTFGAQFVPGPAAAASLYLIFNTMWNLISNKKKLGWLASNHSVTRLITRMGYGTDYLLKTILFSRIFQFSMMSTYFSEAVSYEYAALPAAFAVAYIQRRKPTIQQRIYTVVLALMGGIMLAQKMKTTLALCHDDIQSPAWGIGLGYIMLDIIALGGGGILSVIGFRQAVKDYMLVEESNPLDTRTLISRIEQLVEGEVIKHYKGIGAQRQIDIQSTPKIWAEMQAKVRQEVAVTYLEAFYKNKDEVAKIYINLPKCLERIVHKVTDEVIELMESCNQKADGDLIRSPELNLAVVPMSSNYFSRTRRSVPSSPGITLPQFTRWTAAETESYTALRDVNSSEGKRKESGHKVDHVL